VLNKYPDYQVVCLDKLTYAGNLSTLEGAERNKNFRFVKGDICDRELVFSLFEEEKPDAVVNFAAESHVDRSIADSAPFLRTNVLGTGVLLDACRQFGGVRFHHISTDEVYGDLPLAGGEPFTETSPLKGNSPYAASKAAADLLALSYVRTHSLPVTVSRSSNNYGKYQYPEKLIPLVITSGLRGLQIPVYGTGKNVRDWIYVDDHCVAVDAILHRGKVGEVYNVGANCERNNLEIVQSILREVGVSESLVSYVADRKGHDLRYALNTEKLQREVGFVAQTPFADGLKSTVRWYLENEKWWQPLLDKGE
jgi:dTDP-glucose 4,6-dehydratase